MKTLALSLLVSSLAAAAAAAQDGTPSWNSRVIQLQRPEAALAPGEILPPAQEFAAKAGSQRTACVSEILRFFSPWNPDRIKGRYSRSGDSRCEAVIEFSAMRANAKQSLDDGTRHLNFRVYSGGKLVETEISDDWDTPNWNEIYDCRADGDTFVLSYAMPGIGAKAGTWVRTRFTRAGGALVSMTSEISPMPGEKGQGPAQTECVLP